MILHTPLCDLLGIEHPVMLAGMGGVSYAEVCAAVSEAGGFGTLGMAGLEPAQIREQAARVRELTDKPFGIDLLAPIPEVLNASIDIIINSGARAFISGLGVPEDAMRRFQDAGMLVMNMCGTVRHARKGAAAGVDAVICQGTEGGGHTGKVATMSLVPQAVDAVDVPVIAAGGIFDGRGLAAALSLGAIGVWMGTRFIASREAHAASMYKDAVIDCGDDGTVVTRAYSGKTMRVRDNAYVRDWESRPDEIRGFPEQAMISARNNAMGGIGGQMEGLDPDKSCFAMGQSAGGVHDVLSCREIVESTVSEARDVLRRLAAAG